MDKNPEINFIQQLISRLNKDFGLDLNQDKESEMNIPPGSAEYFNHGFAEHMKMREALKKEEEPEMCWNDIRKKLPEVEDQDCLVKNENEFHDIPMHRAYWSEGYFFSNETSNSFPLLVTHWMILPEE